MDRYTFRRNNSVSFTFAVIFNEVNYLRKEFTSVEQILSFKSDLILKGFFLYGSKHVVSEILHVIFCKKMARKITIHRKR